ncbi:ComF family protein [Fulvivirga kasyanovii]|uniref:ComF family protein n=2 Tax=Fulvivirga kasyanovii TaxID=396812 RepID=A0ABW9RS48_9BACT|nr:ComF family protein [Fulvivirga kasyanovii]
MPKYCMACNNSLVKGEEMICLKCDYEIPKTASHLDKTNFIAAKFYGKVHLQDAIAFYKFTKSGRVQQLLHRLKYHNKPELGKLIGRKYGHELMGTEVQSTYDLIVPVPLHKTKLRRRGYNQSAVFASGLGEVLEILVNDHALRRNVKTSTQTRKSRIERWKNVDNIFVVPKPEEVKEKRVLLVDDVITTGSTLESCARALLDSGCKSVGVAAIAAAK